MVYVKVNETEYPAAISGTLTDRAWDNRASKTIDLAMTHAQAMELFVENAPWSIVERTEGMREQVDEEGNPVLDENGDPVMESYTEESEYDNSEYSVAGDVTDHRDGTLSIKMGKLTELESALELLLGGE